MKINMITGGISKKENFNKMHLSAVRQLSNPANIDLSQSIFLWYSLMISKQKIITEVMRSKMIHMKKTSMNTIKRIIMVMMIFKLIINMMILIQVKMIFKNINKVRIFQTKNILIKMNIVTARKMAVKKMRLNSMCLDKIQKATQKYIIKIILFRL